MTTDLVTIAIPVYERTDFFEEALKSALNQTIQCPILVMDNGSSHDWFKDICNQYPNRVEYHKNASNIGMYPNWNLCFKNSKTPFVMLLGDDDVLDLNYVKHFIEAKQNNPEIKVYYSDYQFLLWPQNELAENPYDNLWGGNTMKAIKQKAINSRLGFPSISCVIDKYLLLDHPFEENVHGSNDWFTIYHFDDDVKVYGEKIALVKYRKHQQANTNDKAVQNLLRITQLLTLCDLSMLLKSNIRNKIVFFGQLRSFEIQKRCFLRDFLSKDSCYCSVYKTILKDYYCLYKVSVVLYAFIKIFYCLSNYGRCRSKKSY